MMKEDITTEELAIQAKKASKRAIEKAKALRNDVPGAFVIF